MIRPVLLATTTLALTACVATDQQPETSTTDQALTVPTCKDDKSYTCLQPEQWSPTNTGQTTLSYFWPSGAKVMIALETMGRSPADQGSTSESKWSTYVFLVAGAPDGTNTLYRAIEVKASLLTNFRNLANGYNATQEGLVDSRWDGGTGGTNGGSPGGHIGPHGYPWLLINHVMTTAADLRNDYGNGVQGAIRGMNGERAYY